MTPTPWLRKYSTKYFRYSRLRADAFDASLVAGRGLFLQQLVFSEHAESLFIS